jgi:hypothetical protein
MPLEDDDEEGRCLVNIDQLREWLEQRIRGAETERGGTEGEIALAELRGRIWTLEAVLRYIGPVPSESRSAVSSNLIQGIKRTMLDLYMREPSTAEDAATLSFRVEVMWDGEWVVLFDGMKERTLRQSRIMRRTFIKGGFMARIIPENL